MDRLCSRLMFSVLITFIAGKIELNCSLAAAAAGPWSVNQGLPLLLFGSIKKKFGVSRAQFPAYDAQRTVVLSCFLALFCLSLTSFLLCGLDGRIGG